jgi:hypothetical protein
MCRSLTQMTSMTGSARIGRSGDDAGRDREIAALRIFRTCVKNSAGKRGQTLAARQHGSTLGAWIILLLWSISRPGSSDALPLSPAAAATENSAAAHSDSQLWTEIDTTLPLIQHLELTWVSLARFSSQLGGPVTYANGLYADVAVGGHLILTPFYSQYGVDGYASGIWAHTREPGFDLTIAGGPRQCLFSDRSRVYHVLGEATSPWVYRNRPRIDCRVGSEPRPVTLYLSDEFFYYSTFGAWTRYRLLAGARKALNKRCTIDLYYVRQVDQRQLPGVINGLGVTFGLRVGKVE